MGSKPLLLRHASCSTGGLCHMRSSPRPGAVLTLCRPGACSSLLRLARKMRWQTYMPTYLVRQPLSQHRCSMQTVTCAARRRLCGWCIRTAQLPIRGHQATLTQSHVHASPLDWCASARRARSGTAVPIEGFPQWTTACEAHDTLALIAWPSCWLLWLVARPAVP